MRGLLCPARVQRALITLRQATCGAEVSLTPNSPQAQIRPLRQDSISSLRHFPLYRFSQVCLVGHKWSVDEVLSAEISSLSPSSDLRHHLPHLILKSLLLISFICNLLQSVLISPHSLTVPQSHRGFWAGCAVLEVKRGGILFSAVASILDIASSENLIILILESGVKIITLSTAIISVLLLSTEQTYDLLKVITSLLSVTESQM